MSDAHPHKGLLIVVVGPSGAGKDTLLNEIRKDADLIDVLHFVKRTITRKEMEDAEDFLPSSEDDFFKAKEHGAFCMTWQAHGLHYGIPHSALELVEAGKTVLVNGARRALPELKNIFRHITVIKITADPDVLAMRLMERGREDASAIKARLEQQDLEIDSAFDVINIDNSGSLVTAVAGIKRELKKIIETRTLESIDV